MKSTEKHAGKEESLTAIRLEKRGTDRGGFLLSSLLQQRGQGRQANETPLPKWPSATHQALSSAA
jgi:hypothetical protein